MTRRDDVMTREAERRVGTTTHLEESVGCGSAAGAVAWAVERTNPVVGDAKDRARSSDTPSAIVDVATAGATPTAPATTPSPFTSCIAPADSDVTGFGSLCKACGPISGGATVRELSGGASAFVPAWSPLSKGNVSSMYRC